MKKLSKPSRLQLTKQPLKTLSLEVRTGVRAGTLYTKGNTAPLGVRHHVERCI
jgi:hypothetical protein